MPPGTVLRDFTLESVLGHGGFGIVYLARHNLLAHRVAIKEYLPAELAVREGESVHPRSPDFAEYLEDGRRRFQEEAQALIKFRHHPSIVTCMEFFESNGTAYLVMEYEDGQPLSEVLRKRELEGRPFTEADLLEIAIPLLEGLRKVHQTGVVHRDIKPANIFVRYRDHTPVLIDFGAAKQEVAAHSKSMAPYTPGYAAFEQVGEGPLGPWTDIYAVGAVLWRMVAGGQPPAQGLNPVRVERRMAAKMRQQDDPLSSASQLGAGRFSMGVLRAIDQCLEVLDDERVRDCNALLGILLAKDKSRTSGLPDKQANLGQIHGSREGITTDTLRAIDWYRAADQGDVDAQYRFGRMHALGEDVSQSHSEAAKWFRKAADQGHAEAQFALGHCYAKGIGMPADSAEAIRWYHKAANQGHAEAQFALGHCCAKGIGMPTDSAEAVQWYRKAADQGHAKAQFALDHCYAKRLAPSQKEVAKEGERDRPRLSPSQKAVGKEWERDRPALVAYLKRRGLLEKALERAVRAALERALGLVKAGMDPREAQREAENRYLALPPETEVRFLDPDQAPLGQPDQLGVSPPAAPDPPQLEMEGDRERAEARPAGARGGPLPG